MQTHRAPAAWDRAALLQSTAWRTPVPEAVAEEFVAYCAAHPGQASAAAEFHLTTTAMPRLRSWAVSLREELLGGLGVVVVGGLAGVRGRGGDPLSDAERRLFYVALGQGLGRPLTAYGVLYPVVDRGVDYTATALPVSMTSATTDFHTDSSAVDSNPDLVGLLCETPSHQGGASLVTSAARVFERLALERPEVLRVLRQSFLRDVVTPGVEKTHANLLRNRFPIFDYDASTGALQFRYMRYWIERGHDRAGVPLSDAERQALDALDAELSDPAHVVSFDLRRGEILWVNNRLVAHNRTAYQDTPRNVRALWRMWIAVDPPAA